MHTFPYVRTPVSIEASCDLEVWISQGSNVEDLQQGGDAAEYLAQQCTIIMEFNASAVRHNSFMTP